MENDSSLPLSRSDTPLASSNNPSPISTAMPDPQSAPSADQSKNTIMFPMPTFTASGTQVSFVYPDNVDECNVFGPLPPEVASADISIALDGSFVETPSGPAAMELKRRYDQHYGVGKDVRSPYAITALINQHGKQMYRVGLRDMSATDPSAADAEQESSRPLSIADSPDQTRHKRLSQMGFHVFKNGTLTRPLTASPQQHAPRKLRKTRSIPDNIRPPNDHVGRGHSQSVTSADTFSVPNNLVASTTSAASTRPSKRGDMFGDIMSWSSPDSSSCSSASSLRYSGEPSSEERFPSHIMFPFGHGVSFDSPAKPSTSVERLRTPRLLREMQSFESTRTARQHTDERAERISAVPSLASSSESEDAGIRRPPSAIRLRDLISLQATEALSPPSAFEPSFPNHETVLHSRYSTDIFDVLQTYRGLPLQFDKLLDNAGETTVKMSLDDAAPKNDPRFVIWGEIHNDQDDVSVSQDSFTDFSPSVHSSSLSKRRSAKGKGKASELPALQLSAGSDTERVLIAATIERWIAQLTSVLNYDELLVFFLTYRTFIRSVDLCHLLICRFHWALQTTGSVTEDKIRRIVRTRTFVAFRYWLLTFFTVDFLPNRELRLLVANWLNALIRDPILEKHVDGVNTVKKLIKVVKDCKKAHTRTPAKPKPRTKSTAGRTPTINKGEKLFGEKFAEATRKQEVDDEDSDVDLDFLDEADTGNSSFQSNSATADLTSISLGNTLSPSGPNSIPPSSLSILQQTDHALGHQPDSPAQFSQAPATLPIHHGPLSRAFVKTIGHLGRWKRVLNSRSTTVRTPLTACTTVSAFELEPVGRDLLNVRGGVEQYLRLIEQQLPEKSPAVSSQPPRTPASAPVVSRSSIVVQSPIESPLPSGSTEESTESNTTAVPFEPPPEYGHDVDEISLRSDDADDEDYLGMHHNGVTVEVLDIDEDRSSLARSSSTDSFGQPLSSVPAFQSPWGFDVVSIDDLDLSDTSSDLGGPALPPGLRRPNRRLPLRRDFEFAPRPESVSSMGIHTRDSMMSETSSATSSVSINLGGNIHQWQMAALIDSLTDDGGPGDREDALRRLEGQINPQERREKASKVDGWVRAIQVRMAAGDYSDEQPHFPDDDSDESGEADGNSLSAGGSPNRPEIVIAEAEIDQDTIPDSASTPIPPEDSGTPHPIDAKPAPEDAVPIEILQSRMPPEAVASPPRPPTLSKFAPSDSIRVHRSFVLGHRAEVLAQHFAMIDRELFMGVRFEELVLEDWMACEEVDIFDWAQYLKDRARWKVELRFTEKTTAVAAVRARFNLMSNFVISEIVLTAPNDRSIVFAKFLRIAWKSYCLQSFNTLVAIIAALRSSWVTGVMKRHWNRLGMWETRIFNDFKQWCTSEDCFKHIRQTINALIDAKPLDAGSHTASVVSGGVTASETSRSKGGDQKSVLNPACVPFIGVYLTQLHNHSRLPDLIDPTCPTEAVIVDPVTGNFERPTHPEVFSTLARLPPSMDLEPLINVHKQRMIAGVIKSLVASQHLASRVQFSVDKKLFQKCLRLRALDTETLQRAVTLFTDTH